MDGNGVNITEQSVELARNGYQMQYVFGAISSDIATLQAVILGYLVREGPNMAFLSSMNVVGSGLTAQQLRLDVVSENITNRTTTRTEGGGAYRRKMVVFEAEGERSPFQAALDRALGRGASGTA